MRTLTLFAALLLITAASCKKKSNYTISIFSLPGTWKLVDIHGGFAGGHQVPGNGQHAQYTFRTDSTYTLLTDSNSVSGSYSVRADTPYVPSHTTYLLYTTTSTKPFVMIAAISDSLVLSDHGSSEPYYYTFISQ